MERTDALAGGNLLAVRYRNHHEVLLTASAILSILVGLLVLAAWNRDIRDLSKRKQVEDSLRRRTADLKEARRAAARSTDAVE